MALCFALCLFALPVALAQVRTFQELKDALDGSEGVIELASGVSIVTTTTLSIDRSVTIKAEDGGVLPELNGNAQTPVLNIQAAADAYITVKLIGISIKNGVISSSQFKNLGLCFEDDSCGKKGAAGVLVSSQWEKSQARVEFKDCKIEGHYRGNGGYNPAAIGAYGAGTRLTFSNCEISDNEGKSGYGAVEVSYGAKATFQHCVFRGNKGKYGGALAVTKGGEVDLDNCTLSENESRWGSGGAVAANDGASSVIFRRSNIVDNSNSRDGGTAFFFSGSETMMQVLLVDSTISGNKGFNGANSAIRVLSPYNIKLLVKGCAFNDNVDNNRGAAIKIKQSKGEYEKLSQSAYAPLTIGLFSTTFEGNTHFWDQDKAASVYANDFWVDSWYCGTQFPFETSASLDTCLNGAIKLCADDTSVGVSLAVKELAKSDSPEVGLLNIVPFGSAEYLAAGTTNKFFYQLLLPSDTTTLTNCGNWEALRTIFSTNVFGDPITVYDGVETRFHLPMDELFRVFEQPPIVVSYRASNPVDAARGGDWVTEVAVAVDGANFSTISVKVVDPITLLAADTVRAPPVEGSPLTTMSILADGKPLMAGIHALPHVEVKAAAVNKRKRVGNGYVEVVDVAAEGFRIRIRSAKASKFEDVETQVKALHLDVEFLEFDHNTARGVLPEMWRLQPLSEETKRLLGSAATRAVK